MHAVMHDGNLCLSILLQCSNMVTASFIFLLVFLAPMVKVQRGVKENVVRCRPRSVKV